MEMLGLVVLTNEYKPIINPHIMTSNTCKGVYFPNLEPTVGGIVEIVNVYKFKTLEERESTEPSISWWTWKPGIVCF